MNRNFVLRGAMPALTLALTAPALAQSNIDDASKYAWGENIGWTNWRDAEAGVAGVRVDALAGFLAGSIWAENLGWISAGDGSGPYPNLDGANHGVNIGPGGVLDGFAWGENIGWINFGTAPVIGPSGARYDAAAGRLRGYAWGENIGWINLDDASAFVAIVTCPADLDGDDVVSASDLAALVAQWSQSGPADLNADGTVNAADIASLLSAWGPCP